ncbi:MAG: hypothetical protein ACREAZ_12445 [Nitrososphaera sp.]
MATSGSPPSGKIPFESHLERLTEPARSMMTDLRSFVLSLGGNVLEDVRPHRVVYAKTMNFRTFLDIEPAGDSLVLSIRSGRSAPPATIALRSPEETNVAKKQISEAYQKIQ